MATSALALNFVADDDHDNDHTVPSYFLHIFSVRVDSHLDLDQIFERNLPFVIFLVVS